MEACWNGLLRAADRGGETLSIDAAYVDRHLAGLVGDEDLARYIL